MQPNFEYCIKHKLKDFARYNEDTSGKRTNFNWRLVFNNTVADTITSKPSLIKENATYMNTSELCQIGSYPLDYNFNKNEPHYLIGMSVPPVMIAQIATQIYEQWLKYL